ncbi:hypothetical protein TNCV_2634561 [Trichonephila clavipes]|nr:hypothetical protein TNCV_2634561 [Trichonephila clavipes]
MRVAVDSSRETLASTLKTDRFSGRLREEETGSPFPSSIALFPPIRRWLHDNRTNDKKCQFSSVQFSAKTEKVETWRTPYAPIKF